MGYLANKLGDENNLGYYATEAALISAYAVGFDGAFAIVGATDTFWVWDSGAEEWVDTNSGGGGGSVNFVSNVATARILGRVAAGSGDSQELTKAQTLTFLNVEDGADVTDTANVTSAGALMDSEVTNLAQVKAFDSSDYATAAQGSTADSASQATGVEDNADVTDTANVTSAGALMDSEVTNLAQVKAFDSSDYATASQGSLADSASQATGVEDNADVTDTANVESAGALMDSEVTNLAQVKAFDETDYATPSGTETLTNKRITKRKQTVVSSATVTPSWDNDDIVTITAQAVGLTLANPSGTPTDGQAIVIRILDNGTGRTITYGAAYRAIGVTLLTTTTASKTSYLGGFWNAADSKFDITAVGEEA